VSVLPALLALLGPAVAALVTSALRGPEAWRELRVRMTAWRVPLLWYAVALLLPVAVSLLRTGVELIAGAPRAVGLMQVSPLSAIVFVLVAGEEIGWRGYALPLLLTRFGPWTASVIVGVMWTLWHFPLFFMSAMPQYGTPFVSYVPYLIGLSITLTWLWQRTRGSVVIATVFHGAVNTFGVVTIGTDAILRGWGNAVAYGISAAIIGVVFRSRNG
jgi:membrane protease YdiL (CAAX protease family)